MRLVSDEIAGISPYEPGKPIEEVERELGLAPGSAIKLASNENPLGPSPLAIEAARRALDEAHRYPDGSAFYLRERLAAKLGVAREAVLCGAGSNELIDLLIQTFCAPDEEVIAPAISFACYRLSSEAHRRRFRETANRAQLSYDIPALIAGVSEKTKLVFIANPNNPTGAYFDRAEMELLVEKLPPHVILIVDEAYFEYARAADYPNTLELLARRERLVLLRTFSKIHGLAGLRVGYAVASPELAAWVHRVRLPFNVSAIGQAAALAALDDDAHVQRSQALVQRELPRLSDGLAALGLAVFPSQGNFVLADFAPRDARAIYGALLKKGVIVRPMAGYGLPSCLRITVGREDENARLLSSLKELL